MVSLLSSGVYFLVGFWCAIASSINAKGIIISLLMLSLLSLGVNLRDSPEASDTELDLAVYLEEANSSK